MTRRRLLRAAVLVSLYVLADTGAGAATVRPRATIHGANVKLSDLFDGLQPGQDCDIGPAPLPGIRLVVPTAQLAAIASQFGVDWHQMSGYSAASLERPARVLKREEIVAALMPALDNSGMPADSDVALGPFAPPTLPADVSVAPEVQSLEYDAQTGRFSATLQITPPDGDPITMRVAGRAEESVSVLVLVQGLPAGSSVTSVDVRSTRIRKNSLRGNAITRIADAGGLILRQSLPAGATLVQDQFVRPVVISRGKPVVLRLTSGALLLTAAGIALEAGGIGDRIHFINSLSHAVLIGQVIDSTDIQVDAGTAPVFLQQPGGSGGLPRLASTTLTSMTSLPGPAQEARYP
jgi:flagella basal body P-ring formation protein FlgA